MAWGEYNGISAGDYAASDVGSLRKRVEALEEKIAALEVSPGIPAAVPPPPVAGRIKMVRIALAVWPDGEVICYGPTDGSEDQVRASFGRLFRPGWTLVWVSTAVQIPEA